PLEGQFAGAELDVGHGHRVLVDAGGDSPLDQLGRRVVGLIAPEWTAALASTTLASPKSASRAEPPTRKMFCGLMSRCWTPTSSRPADGCRGSLRKSTAPATSFM